MITLDQLTSSKFFIALAKDLDLLRNHSNEFKFLTVENASQLNKAGDLSENVDILAKYMERCVLWKNSGEYDADLIYDLGQNLSNIANEADLPCYDERIDVREMLNYDEMMKAFNGLIEIIVACELYPKSTIYNLLLMNALAVLWMLYSTVHTALSFFSELQSAPLHLSKFLAQYNVVNVISLEEQKDTTEFGLKFVRHDQQVIFTKEEQAAIDEADRLAAEEERKIQETCEEIKNTNDLQKLLASIVGDKVKVCQSIGDCKKVKALAKMLRAIYAFTINAAMVDDSVAFKGAWDLLNHPNEKPGDGMLGIFEIGDLTPYSIAYWLNELFGSRLEASFVTSMETITLNPDEMYHYDKSSMVMIQNLT